MQSLIDSQEVHPDAPLPEPQPSTSSKQNSPSSYFTYPIKHTFSGVLRRISADSAVKRSTTSSPPHLSALDANGGYTPPRGPTPPFNPPPLTPLTLKGYKPETPSTSQLLSTLLGEEIRLLFPARLQLVETWNLLFSLEQDGASLSTLYSKCDAYNGKRAGFVLVVKDAAGSIFGAYLTDPPHPSNGHYYGTGECFLWRASILPLLPPDQEKPLSQEQEEDLLLANLPPPPSADTTNMQRWTTIGQPEAMPTHHHHDWNSSSPAPATTTEQEQHMQRHRPTQPQPRINTQVSKQQHLLDLSPEEEFGDFSVFEDDNTVLVSSRNPTPPQPSIAHHPASPTAAAHAPPPPRLQPAAPEANTPPVLLPSRTPTPAPSRLRFRAFPYSGVNDYLIFCEPTFLSVGGGDGHYGLWLDRSLERGVSDPCPTFANEALSGEEGSRAAATGSAEHVHGHGGFDVLGVEVWCVGA